MATHGFCNKCRTKICTHVASTLKKQNELLQQLVEFLLVQYECPTPKSVGMKEPFTKIPCGNCLWCVLDKAEQLKGDADCRKVKLDA